jgi:hypothetical protein
MQEGLNLERVRTSGLNVVYTPLCGTGRRPVQELFRRIGVKYTMVAAQAEPDGDFTTCPYPNPETDAALNESYKVANEVHPDLIVGTDPDADRTAIAVPVEGGFRKLSGNELGCVLLDYILRTRSERGDLPKDASETPPGNFSHAMDLVRALRGSGFCLGGACYPECHPDCPHMEDDIRHLREKVEAGLDFVTTQMFFDNNIFYRYLAKLRDHGVTVPVIAGIMPVTNGKQIARICRLSGTYLPSRFKAIVDRYGDLPAAMLDAGVAYATEQIIDLFANGINAVHIYTMNKPEVAEMILNSLSGIIGKETEN